MSVLNDGTDNIWMSISDLMSGLMIVFLFIAISFMIQTELSQEKLKDMTESYIVEKDNIYTNLSTAFEGKAEEWKMEIDEQDGTIRFNEPDVLFDEGKSTVQLEFKKILTEFFPIYIETLYENHKESIKEIRIEGHTSSAWGEGYNELESFFKNMELSQDRTRNVLDYVLNISKGKEYENWLRRYMTANGMSSSRVILDEAGNEDEEKSRRVEFKIVTNSDEIISGVSEELKMEEISD